MRYEWVQRSRGQIEIDLSMIRVQRRPTIKTKNDLMQTRRKRWLA